MADAMTVDPQLRRGESKTGHRPILGEHHVFQVFPHRMAIAQIVILPDQTVVQLFMRCAFLSR